MEKELSVKYIVKVINITKAGQKVHFTIRHPQNATCLNGIAVTATNFRNLDSANDLDATGSLSLAVPSKGDVFFTEDIKLVTPEYREPVEQFIDVPFNPKDFAFAGKRNSYFFTELFIKDAFMEVYYEDYSPKIVSSGGGTVVGGTRGPVAGSSAAPDPNYKVTLYLRYDLQKEKVEEENTSTPESCK